MVNLAFLSSIYGYAALMFTGILASFVYITGKMVKNCSILMLILSSIVILIHTFNDIILVVMSHGKHFEVIFEKKTSKTNFALSFIRASLNSQLYCHYSARWVSSSRTLSTHLKITLTLLSIFSTRRHFHMDRWWLLTLIKKAKETIFLLFRLL